MNKIVILIVCFCSTVFQSHAQVSKEKIEKWINENKLAIAKAGYAFGKENRVPHLIMFGDKPIKIDAGKLIENLNIDPKAFRGEFGYNMGKLYICSFNREFDMVCYSPINQEISYVLMVFIIQHVPEKELNNVLSNLFKQPLPQ